MNFNFAKKTLDSLKGFNYLPPVTLCDTVVCGLCLLMKAISCKSHMISVTYHCYFPTCCRASCWDAQTRHLLYLVITSISIVVKVIMLQYCSSTATASLYIWKVCPILPCNKTCLSKCIMTDHWQHISNNLIISVTIQAKCVKQNCNIKNTEWLHLCCSTATESLTLIICHV